MTVKRHEPTASGLTDLLFDEPDVGRCLVAPDGRVLRVNAEWLRSTGFSLNDVLGADIIDLFPATHDVALAMHARARAGHRVEVPRHALTLNGRETWWEGSIAPIPMEGGTGVLITARELQVPQRKASDVAHRETRLRRLYDSGMIGVVDFDLGGQIIDANDEFLSLTGYTREDLAEGRAAWDRMTPPEYRALDEHAVAELKERGVETPYEKECIRKDGSRVSIIVGAATYDEQRQHGIGFVLDVSERKRAEEALRDSDVRYRTLFDSIDEGFCIIDVLFDETGKPNDYRFVEVNPAFEQHTGLVNAEGRRIRELVPQQDEHWFQTYGRVAMTGEPIRFQSRGEALNRDYDVYAVRVGAPEKRRVAVLFNDVSERKRTEEALRDNQARLEYERARLQAIIDTIPVGFFLLERGGKVVVTNDEAKRMWAGALPLQKIADYDKYVGYWPETGEQLKAEEWPAAQALQHGRRTKSVMVDIERFDGTRGTILFSGAPIRDGAGSVTGAVVATQDISELRAAHARLEEIDRRKTEFMAMLSHELRNPLAPIRNSICLLERAAPGSEQATRAREVVRRQTEHLTRLVDDLLDVTRISRGKIELDRERLDAREIVRKITEDLHGIFEQDGIELRVDHLGFTPVWVDVDPTRLSQVVGNLLQNAAKFTPTGGTVAVSLTSGKGAAELRVRDTGSGMDPAQVPGMFEPFVQAQQSLARSKGGLGLGLALVKGLVELHGGTVEGRSEGVGRGSEFTVRLPLAPPPSADVKGGARAPAPRRRIVIIEDNLDAAETLAELLALEGHEVTTARDARSGIALVQEVVPDVVLCDLGLPDADGYDVARTLRRDERLRRVRLIALSGYAQPEDRERARAAGFDGHIAKPPDLDELGRLLAEES